MRLETPKFVAMPNVDAGAKAWELDLAGRVGRAVLTRRRVLKMTAVQLAERTKKLGYPITRVTVTKIENNTRAGKLDVAELLILAASLNMPPALLLFPDYPGGNCELLPGVDADGQEAVRWLSGAALMPPEIADDGTVRLSPSNAGVELVKAASQRADLQHNELRRLIEWANEDKSQDIEETERMMTAYKVRLAELDRSIDEARARLWGTGEGDSE